MTCERIAPPVALVAGFRLAVLGGADLSNASLRETNVRCANLVGTSGLYADFTGADLYYARPGNAKLSGAIFANTYIERTIFRRADLSGCDFTGSSGHANFEGANLKGVIR